METSKLEIIKSFSTDIQHLNFDEQVDYLEKKLKESNSPDVVVGNSDLFPLKHSFLDGIYVREIEMKAGAIAIGKIHKKESAFFLIKGKVLFFTEQGVEEKTAPFYGTSQEGSRRVVLILEDSVFVNVHSNPENITDIDALESKFVASSLDDYKKVKKIK